jgi:membrane-bound lytic murein transglycosylase B
MVRKPEPSQKPINWKVYKIANKAVWLGVVEAANEATAMEKAAAEFKVPASRLMAIQR